MQIRSCSKSILEVVRRNNELRKTSVRLLTYFNELTNGTLGGGEIEDSWSHVDWRMVWQILDQAQVQLAGERFDEVHENSDTARRRHG